MNIFLFGLLALVLMQNSEAAEDLKVANLNSLLSAAGDLSYERDQFKNETYQAIPNSSVAIRREKIEAQASSIDFSTVNLPIALKEWDQKEQLEVESRMIKLKKKDGVTEGPLTPPYYYSTVPNGFVTSTTGDIWNNYLENNLSEKLKACGLRSDFFMGNECRKILAEGSMIEKNFLLISAKNIGVIPKELNYRPTDSKAAWPDVTFKPDKVFNAQQREKFKNILFDLYKDLSIKNLDNYKNSSPHPISALQSGIAMGDSRAMGVANKLLSDFSKKKSASYDINADPNAQYIYTVLSGYNMFFTSTIYDPLKKAEVALEIKDPLRGLYGLNLDYLNSNYKFSQIMNVESYIQSAEIDKNKSRQQPTEPAQEPNRVGPKNAE